MGSIQLYIAASGEGRIGASKVHDKKLSVFSPRCPGIICKIRYGAGMRNIVYQPQKSDILNADLSAGITCGALFLFQHKCR